VQNVYTFFIHFKLPVCVCVCVEFRFAMPLITEHVISTAYTKIQ